MPPKLLYIINNDYLMKNKSKDKKRVTLFKK